MTIDGQHNEDKHLVVLPKGIHLNVEIFELPHPSNNISKKPLNILVHDGQIYQLKTKQFSKGSEYHKQKDLVTDRYHYTSDSQPFKSTFLINTDCRKDGYVLEDSKITYSEKYDLTFSICGYFYRSNTVANEESVFSAVNKTNGKIEPEVNFYSASDYQERFVDTFAVNFSKIPLELFEAALSKISLTVEEAGDKYYKINEGLITEWLVKKVTKLKDNFPESLQISSALPDEVRENLKTIMSCNLLVSLIPQLAYQQLINHQSSVANVKNAFSSYDEYKNKTQQAVSYTHLDVYKRQLKWRIRMVKSFSSL